MKITPGDIFEVKLKDRRKYFQFIYKDDEYMAGHLIRTFDYEISSEEQPDIDKIIESPILSYTYTRVIEGIKKNLWKKIGNISIEKNFESPIFRQTNDVYSLTPKSFNWFIWKGNINNRKTIGELIDKYKKLPISGVFPPYAVVKWIDTGDNGFKEPE